MPACRPIVSKTVTGDGRSQEAGWKITTASHHKASNISAVTNGRTTRASADGTSNVACAGGAKARTASSIASRPFAGMTRIRFPIFRSRVRTRSPSQRTTNAGRSPWSCNVTAPRKRTAQAVHSALASQAASASEKTRSPTTPFSSETRARRPVTYSTGISMNFADLSSSTLRSRAEGRLSSAM